MVRHTLVAVALGTAVAVPVGNVAVAESPASFDAALSSALGNVATPKGRLFDDELARQFQDRHEDALVRCREGIKESDLVSFDLLMKLAADGKGQAVLVRPDTPVSACLRSAVRNDVYKKPPRPAYWVRVAMSFKR